MESSAREREVAMRGINQLVTVIDDSLVMRKILEVCLHRAGYEARSFADGVEVFRWLETPEARIPALIFVDVCLPRIDGYTVIRRLKARPAFAQTVFVIISQYNGVLDRLKGRLAGAKEYLTKPCKTQDILAVVQTYLGPPAGGNADEMAAAATPGSGNTTYTQGMHAITTMHPGGF
jgi:CheY-like chemotaxis protein